MSDYFKNLQESIRLGATFDEELEPQRTRSDALAIVQVGKRTVELERVQWKDSAPGIRLRLSNPERPGGGPCIVLFREKARELARALERVAEEV